jgi:hypothetical protein
LVFNRSAVSCIFATAQKWNVQHRLLTQARYGSQLIVNFSLFSF